MFKESPGNPEKETIIGPSVRVEGDFIMDGNIIIDGTVCGTIKTSKDLTVGKPSVIFANIEAGNAIIAGEVQGNLLIHNRLELKATAKIFGDVATTIIDIEAGAILNGHCQMAEQEKAAKPSSIKQEKIALEDVPGSKKPKKINIV
jgi:cytoskeletal protein CcmA (bactofilin family)